MPSVPPADLPRVRRKDFDSYLKAIKPEWDKFEKNAQRGKEGQAQPEPLRFGSIQEEVEEDTEEGLLTVKAEAPAAPASPIPIQHKSIPPLDTVPPIFFQPDFNLGDARTFNAVTEQSSITSLATPTQSNHRVPSREDEDDDPADPLSLSHTLPLLEKFDHYADTVEQHLIREISLRSTSFFAALTNLRDLQTSSTACLSRIQNLRQKLREVDEGTAKKGLELVKVKQKESRVQEVKAGLKMIEGVIEMMGVLKGLVNAGQWEEALNIVEELEGMWEAQKDIEGKSADVEQPANGHAKLESMPEEEEGESEVDSPTRSPQNSVSPRNPIPLSSLTAFSAMPSHLQSIFVEIATSLSKELVAMLKDDWSSYVESRQSLDFDEIIAATQRSPAISTVSRSNGEGKRVEEPLDQALRDRLKPLLLSLARTKGLKEGVLSWKEAILSEVKALVSKVRSLPCETRLFVDTGTRSYPESKGTKRGRTIPGLGLQITSGVFPKETLWCS